MNDADFQFLRTFLQVRSGMALGNDGRYLAESRLPAVCRRFSLCDVSVLIAILRAGVTPEVERAVVEAMVTQETFFFRDKATFAQLAEVVLPALIQARSSSRRLRIWCAAASTGQEPYSLAIILDGMAPFLAGWTVDIIATDLSDTALERGRKGLYSHFEVQRGLPIQLLLKYFEPAGESWQISPRLRAMVTFASANLMEDVSGLGLFDLILCRNVLIYFDESTKRQVLERVADRLAVDGSLVLGGVETPAGLTEKVVADPSLKGIYGRRVGCPGGGQALDARRAPGLPPSGREVKAPDRATAMVTGGDGRGQQG